jgi:hypothetical protein
MTAKSFSIGASLHSQLKGVQVRQIPRDEPTADFNQRTKETEIRFGRLSIEIHERLNGLSPSVHFTFALYCFRVQTRFR